MRLLDVWGWGGWVGRRTPSLSLSDVWGWGGWVGRRTPSLSLSDVWGWGGWVGRRTPSLSLSLSSYLKVILVCSVSRPLRTGSSPRESSFTRARMPFGVGGWVGGWVGGGGLNELFCMYCIGGWVGGRTDRVCGCAVRGKLLFHQRQW